MVSISTTNDIIMDVFVSINISIAMPGIAANIPKTPPVAITEAIPPAVISILINLHPYFIFL